MVEPNILGRASRGLTPPGWGIQSLVGRAAMPRPIPQSRLVSSVAGLLMVSAAALLSALPGQLAGAAHAQGRVTGGAQAQGELQVGGNAVVIDTESEGLRLSEAPALGGR